MVHGLNGTRFREYRVHGFGGIWGQVMGYIVSHYPYGDNSMGTTVREALLIDCSV